MAECTDVGFVNTQGRCVLVSHEDNQCGNYTVEKTIEVEEME